jgi:hypothetical protein
MGHKEVREQFGFVELTPYPSELEGNNIQIDVDFGKWLKLIGLSKKEYNALPEDEEMGYFDNDYYAKEVLKYPSKFGVRKVYVYASDKAVFEKHGIRLRKMSNNLFLSVDKKDYGKLADMDFVRME